jgi:flagellar operon protein
MSPAPIRTTSPLPPVEPPGRPAAGRQLTGAPGAFGDVLREKLDSQPAGGVSFSKHALDRLGRRGISPTPAQQQRLAQGVSTAASKGSRSSLIMVDDLAFVVGVPARTVVTAIDTGSMGDRAFTNIDSAVIA